MDDLHKNLKFDFEIRIIRKLVQGTPVNEILTFGVNIDLLSLISKIPSILTRL